MLSTTSKHMSRSSLIKPLTTMTHGETYSQPIAPPSRSLITLTVPTMHLANQPPTDSQWQNLDQLLKLWLFGSISQSLITSAHSVNATAHKIWLNIEAIFRQNNDATAIQLENELRTITMGELSIHDYFNKIKKITDLLEGIGEKVKEKHVVIHALNGLSTMFDNNAGII